MTAESVMDPNPTVLRPNDTIKTAAEYIMEHRYRSLPVVDEEGLYLGIFGVNCLLKLILPKAAIMEPGLENVGFIQDSLQDLHKRLIEMQDQPISVCMTTDITTVTPNTPLVETARRLFLDWRQLQELGSLGRPQVQGEEPLEDEGSQDAAGSEAEEPGVEEPDEEEEAWGRLELASNWFWAQTLVREPSP